MSTGIMLAGIGLIFLAILVVIVALAASPSELGTTLDALLKELA